MFGPVRADGLEVFFTMKLAAAAAAPHGRKRRFSDVFRILMAIFMADSKQGLVDLGWRWMPLCLGLKPVSQQIVLHRS